MSLPSPFLRVEAFGSWLRRESLRHILASPGYAPGTIAINVTRMKRGFNACKTRRCIYASVFNRFWDIASYWSKIADIFILLLQHVTDRQTDRQTDVQLMAKTCFSMADARKNEWQLFRAFHIVIHTGATDTSATWLDLTWRWIWLSSIGKLTKITSLRRITILLLPSNNF